jgi:hypothetical protein
MTSAIDPTKPVGPVAYTADLRGNLQHAHDEITALQSRATDTVSVKDPTFGAVADGVADDGPAIRAAIASLNGLPGAITLPAGTYRVTGGYFVLSSGQRVTGAGATATIIKPDTLSNVDGTHSIFVNTLRDTLGASTSVPTTPANQTDHDIQIDNIGFDLSNCATPATATSLGSFLLARNITIENIHADNYQPGSAKGFSGFQFIGCDNYMVSNYVARNAVNAIDNWKGTTRGKISNVAFESANAAGNGGLINWNSIGTTRADFGTSVNLQISNASFRINSGSIALFLDSLGAASVSQDILLNNITISATSGTTGNIGIIFRGMTNRLKIRGASFHADPGCDMQPIIVGGFYDGTAPATGNNLITTVNGSSQITVTYPGGANSGPGNYMQINNGSGGAVVGNGLNLNGYYLITAVSGPVTSVSCGNLFTVTAPNVATADGSISGTTHLQNWWGCPASCEFIGLTFDGISARGGDLISLGGGGHQVIGVVVTSNYQGNATPQYRSVISTDSTQALVGSPVGCNILGVIAAPGTGALVAGFNGDNVITWRGVQPFSWYGGNAVAAHFLSTIDATIGTASTNFLTLQGRATGFPPRILAQGADANVSLGLHFQGAGNVQIQDGGGATRHIFETGDAQLGLSSTLVPAFKATGVASQANFVTVQSAVTGSPPLVSAIDSGDTDVSVRYGGKGAGGMLGRALQIFGPPTVNDLPSGFFTVAQNGTAGQFCLYYNFNGTMLSSAVLS